MSLGVPAQVAREAGNLAVARSTQVAALICLASATASVLAPGLFLDVDVRWWATGSLLPMAALMVVVMVKPSLTAMVAYIAVGVASTFAYTFALLEQTVTYTDTNLFVVALPLVALMLIGGSGSDARIGVLWATVAYAVGDLAVFAAATVAHRQFRFDSISLATYVLFMALLLFHGVTRSAHRGAHTLIMRMLRQQHADELRRALVAELRAELHDTTLSELAAIATAAPGPVPEAFRERLQSDIRHWTDETQRVQALAVTDERDWRATELAQAIAQARDAGLVVDVSGDFGPYTSLTPDARRAVGLAARQCLVNVLKHSGQSAADVMLSASGGAVSLVVVDAGRGFDVGMLTAEGNDRMGLMHSVIERVERVGGSVSVFSKPGAGTSVLMVVPLIRSEDVV
jgi:signal transduction histidine kinase